MRRMGCSLVLLLLVVLPVSALEIVGEKTVKAYRLVRLDAKDAPKNAALIWDVSPEQDVDIQETKSGIVLSAPPGEYRVKLRSIFVADGITEIATARATVTIQPPPGPLPPGPGPLPPGPGPKVDPVKATGKLRFGSSGCTATVMSPRRADGRWDVLTASHCTGAVGSKGQVTLKDGKVLNVTVTARDTRSDLSWMVTEESNHDDLYVAQLADTNPAIGVAVWHEGYGIDRPANHEDGVITGGETAAGQLELRISVSSGDSGSGFFRKDNGQLVAVVCCGSGLRVWGGSCQSAAKLRPKSEDVSEWVPVPIPPGPAPAAPGPCSAYCACGCQGGAGCACRLK